MAITKLIACVLTAAMLTACSTRNDGFDYGHIIIKHCDAGKCQ